jgi:hypothetical protein
VAPRLPGFFCDLNYQEDRWRCPAADGARSTQFAIREPIGYGLSEKSDNAPGVA